MQTKAVDTSLSSVTGTYTAPSKELGKNEFLKLLMAQLANQDPTNPVDNQAFIAQLAQFSSVEQLYGIGSKLDTLAVAQASANQLQTASLVGKEVTFRTDQVHLDGKALDVEANLAGAADAVVAVVTDASGNVVRTLPLGARTAGTTQFTWDGCDDKGKSLPAGDYHVALNATRKDGTPVQADLRGRGTVDGVNFEGDAPILLVGSLQVRLSDVARIERSRTSGA
jgi:flagellar basal-body rod modification protein FlgD